MKKLGIIGGGITGLTCAYRLQGDFEVTLFEKSHSLGGQARSVTNDQVTVESAVSVVAETTYVEFFELMREIGFNDFIPYELTGLHVHDRSRTVYYIDVKPERIKKLLPSYIKDKPFGLVNNLQLITFISKLYADHESGKLDGVLVLDAYTLYPQYKTLITAVLSILSLITSVQIKNTTISHILNFIYDFDNNRDGIKPVQYLFKLFGDVTIPNGGVSTYIKMLSAASNAEIISENEVVSLVRNTDETVTVKTENNSEYIFDEVIIATQPFQVASFLRYKNDHEKQIFESLAKAKTKTLVTNHNDLSILGDVGTAVGLVDFRLDYHENTSQTTIDRRTHLYTAQTLPDHSDIPLGDYENYLDTAITSDNYSIDPTKIYSQHVVAVSHMTLENKKLFSEMLAMSGNDNLYFACAALSSYPTSQEGGVRAANLVSKHLKEKYCSSKSLSSVVAVNG